MSDNKIVWKLLKANEEIPIYRSNIALADTHIALFLRFIERQFLDNYQCYWQFNIIKTNNSFEVATSEEWYSEDIKCVSNIRSQAVEIFKKHYLQKWNGTLTRKILLEKTQSCPPIVEYWKTRSGSKNNNF